MTGVQTCALPIFNHFKGISPLIKLLLFSILIKIVVYLTVCVFYLVIELLGVSIIGVFLLEELLGLIRLSVCLSLLLKEIIIVPSVFRAIKSGFVFSIFGVRAMACSCHCSGRFISFHCICWGTRSLLFRF